MPPPAVIKLNLVNQSFDRNRSKVVLFQRSLSPDFQALALAWRVIENLGFDWTHPFEYSRELELDVRDAYGNVSRRVRTQEGQRWSVVSGECGEQLVHEGPTPDKVAELQVCNTLAQGALDVHVWRDDRPVARSTDIAPGQLASFHFKPVLCLGVVSQVTQGEVLDAAILSRFHTELDLSGVSSADIVMTGGGSGRSARPFHFALHNVRAWR